MIIVDKKIRSYKKSPDKTSTRWLEFKIDLINNENLDYHELEFEMKHYMNLELPFGSVFQNLEPSGQKKEDGEHWKFIGVLEAELAEDWFIRDLYDRWIENPETKIKSKILLQFFEENKKNGVMRGQDLKL